MSKYTAEDFANARFATTQLGGYAAHRKDDGWCLGGEGRSSDEEMSAAGWVPVPTKPTITQSQLNQACDNLMMSDAVGEFVSGIGRLAKELGIEIVPDPPTNAEKLANVYRDWCGRDEVPNSLIRFMDEAGVTAPEEK